MQMMKKISMGCDHAGYGLKLELSKKLEASGYEISDRGTYSEESVDYPDYAHRVAEEVEHGDMFGILICGSANGVAMAANKHRDIRAAICWTQEIAALSRQHNNANILCLPARFVSQEEAFQITEKFLNTSFEGGRHENRINKIACN
jgi:ribose 5-phosphate isomerase B